MNLMQFKDTIQSSHINFLFGSGISVPYAKTLGKIEEWLTEAENVENEKVRQIVQTSLYAKYFNDVIFPFSQSMISENKEQYNNVLTEYKLFFKTWNEIIAKRNISLLEKKVNIFTTNIDTFFECAAEKVGAEFNDGFRGHINPIYREESFANVVSKTSTLYHNSAMIPVFNLLKLHGSINWFSKDGVNVGYSKDLELLNGIHSKLSRIPQKHLFSKYKDDTTYDNIRTFAEDEVCHESVLTDNDYLCIKEFKDEYDKLIMINPRKSKFRESVLDLHFYELMRLLSNALESSSTLLMVSGFSFADEHISKIVLRGASANPTLLVVIFAFDDDAAKAIRTNLDKVGHTPNNNIMIVTPNEFKKWCNGGTNEEVKDLAKFDFASLNKYVFNSIKHIIR